MNKLNMKNNIRLTIIINRNISLKEKIRFEFKKMSIIDAFCACKSSFRRIADLFQN
jgi:hypothetical protein